MRTRHELSVVAPESSALAAERISRGWRALKLEGPFPLQAVGVLAAVAVPLAAAHVSVLPFATYDTDYILVRQAQLRRALAALTGAGHRVRKAR